MVTLVSAAAASRNKKNRGGGGGETIRCWVPTGAALVVVLLLVLVVSQVIMGNTRDTLCPTLLLTSATTTTTTTTADTGTAATATATAATPDTQETVHGTQQQDFYTIALRTGTDKVQGQKNWNNQIFKFTQNENPYCQVWGHFYHTFYQKWLGPLSTRDVEPFQFLEIGYSNGGGFAAFLEFLPQAEMHSIEFKCDLLSQRQKDKAWHQELSNKNRFHCGDSSNYDFLIDTWTNAMKRPDAPPLFVVVDDASHISRHQAASVFFWFPRIAPGGLMIVEDVQPNSWSNQFRNEFLPQIMVDVHYCGDPGTPDVPCFPTLQPLLKSVHCEMHICVLERNDRPAVEYPKEQSVVPPRALQFEACREKKKRAATPKN